MRYPGIDLSSHYFSNSASDINQIMSTILCPLDLNFFRYLKLYKNEDRVHLCNNNAWTNHFYQQGQYMIAWYDRQAHIVHIKEKFKIQFKDQFFSQLQELNLFEIMIKNGLILINNMSLPN